MYCDLDLGDITLGQSHDTASGHEQQLCEILSRFKMGVRSYGPDTDFQYICTLTLTLEISPWVKIIIDPLVKDNKSVKYYSNQTWQWGVMDWAQILSICSLWPWPLRHDLGSKSWHNLGSWTAIVWNVIRSNMTVWSYGLDIDFQYICTETLILEMWP